MLHLSATDDAAWGIRLTSQEHRTLLCAEIGPEARSAGAGLRKGTVFSAEFCCFGTEF